MVGLDILYFFKPNYKNTFITHTIILTFWDYNQMIIAFALTFTGNELSTDQVKMSGNLYSSSEDFFNGFWVFPTEIGNCVMIRFEAL